MGTEELIGPAFTKQPDSRGADRGQHRKRQKRVQRSRGDEQNWRKSVAERGLRNKWQEGASHAAMRTAHSRAQPGSPTRVVSTGSLSSTHPTIWRGTWFLSAIVIIVIINVLIGYIYLVFTETTYMQKLIHIISCDSITP